MKHFTLEYFRELIRLLDPGISDEALKSTELELRYWKFLKTLDGKTNLPGLDRIAKVRNPERLLSILSTIRPSLKAVLKK